MFRELLQATAGAHATWDALRGKVVVLEFWATWCPPCVKALPHFNSLADELKGKPVQFISITDEDKATVTAFLAQHPIHGWVGLNPTDSMFKSYAAEGRPLTVVIRPDGIIDATISPIGQFPIRAENLLNLVAGKASGGLVSSQVVYAGEVHDDSGLPITGVTVQAISMATDTSFSFLGTDTSDKDGHFRIERALPPSYVNNKPVRLEFFDSNHLYGRLEDLRLFAPEQQTHLHVGMLDGNTLTGRVMDTARHAVAKATVRANFGTQINVDQKDGTSNDRGQFEIRGLPSKPVELRVLAHPEPLVLQTGTARIDLGSSGRSVDVVVSPLLPSDAIIHDFAGIKVIDVDASLQARLFLDHPALLIIDPGPHSERFGMYQLRPGDCLWAVDKEKVIGSAAGLARLIVDRFTAVDRGRPVRLVYGLKNWGDFAITSGSDKLQLTDDDLARLRNFR